MKEGLVSIILIIEKNDGWSGCISGDLYYNKASLMKSWSKIKDTGE